MTPGGRDRARPNPVDDTGFTRPLARALHGHVDRVAASPARPGTGPRPAGVGGRGVRVAAAWVYLRVLVAWAEDHGLVDPWLRVEAKPRREWFLAKSTTGPRGWLAHTFAALAVHPATWCLADPLAGQYRVVAARRPAHPIGGRPDDGSGAA
jgi:hypothetical protein